MFGRYDNDPYYVHPQYEQGHSEGWKEAAPLIDEMAAMLDELTSAAGGLIDQKLIESAWALMDKATKAIKA